MDKEIVGNQFEYKGKQLNLRRASRIIEENAGWTILANGNELFRWESVVEIGDSSDARKK